jgi:DNA-binding NarL/FixJ family response regulator
MSSTRNHGPIRIGLVADEPIRLAGLASIFDQPAGKSHAQLVAVPGSIAELLAQPTLEYLVVDLHSSAISLKALDLIRRTRPDIRLIVIGPEANEELVMKSIVSGARAYLDLKAGPETVRKAIGVVTEGSIWAPRRLLSKLIDRLLKTSIHSRVAEVPQLTSRERQVLELIMQARSNREIASELGIEERTVRAHLGRLMHKAGVDNRIKLSMAARSLFQMPLKASSRPNAPGHTHRLITK